MEDQTVAPQEASRIDDDPKETGYGTDADQVDGDAPRKSRIDDDPKETGYSILSE